MLAYIFNYFYAFNRSSSVRYLLKFISLSKSLILPFLKLYPKLLSTSIPTLIYIELNVYT